MSSASNPNDECRDELQDGIDIDDIVSEAVEAVAEQTAENMLGEVENVVQELVQQEFANHKEEYAEAVNERERQGIEPEANLRELFQEYLDERSDNRDSTLRQYKRHVPPFLGWCENKGIEEIGELTLSDVRAYRQDLDDWEANDGYIVTRAKEVRAFLGYLVSEGYCPEDFAFQLNREKLSAEATARDYGVSQQRMEALLDYWDTFEKAKREHACLRVLNHCILRIGGARALDLCDYDPDEGALHLVDRTNTRLKNGPDGERSINLSEKAQEVLNLYIEKERIPVTDDAGRKPLFTTNNGRPSTSTLRTWVYKATSCEVVPPAEEEHDCDGSCSPYSSRCPHSMCPHAVRQLAIERFRDLGFSISYVSERADVGRKTLIKHYDFRDEERKRQNRLPEFNEKFKEM